VAVKSDKIPFVKDKPLTPAQIESNERKRFLKSLSPIERRKFVEFNTHIWWWNRPEIRRKGVYGVNWDEVEETARNYELLRRSPQGKRFTKSYLELDRNEKTVVHALWGNWAKAIYRMVTDRKQFSEKGRTPIFDNEHRQWNLRRSDSDLIKNFMAEIRTLRKMHKIPTPPPLKGGKYGAISWKLVEVLDRNQQGIGKLNASERSTLSDAKGRARKCYNQYKRALERQKQTPDILAALGNPQ
jgi:hypothetical protein